MRVSATPRTAIVKSRINLPTRAATAAIRDASTACVGTCADPNVNTDASKPTPFDCRGLLAQTDEFVLDLQVHLVDVVRELAARAGQGPVDSRQLAQVPAHRLTHRADVIDLGQPITAEGNRGQHGRIGALTQHRGRGLPRRGGSMQSVLMAARPEVPDGVLDQPPP